MTTNAKTLERKAKRAGLWAAKVEKMFKDAKAAPNLGADHAPKYYRKGL